jgi:hypothetical protein
MLGTFFTISASDTASVIDNAKALITDTTPLLTIIVGVAVGVFILWGIIGALKH